MYFHYESALPNRLYWGHEAGLYTEEAADDFPVTGPKFRVAITFDADGDGIKDLLIGTQPSEQTFVLSLFTGTGGRNFEEQTDSPLHLDIGHGRRMALFDGDFTGDGTTDVFVFRRAAESVADAPLILFVGEGQGRYHVMTDTHKAVGTFGSSVISADLTNDGIDDM